jgi:hypothetical protein
LFCGARRNRSSPAVPFRLAVHDQQFPAELGLAAAASNEVRNTCGARMKRAFGAAAEPLRARQQRECRAPTECLAGWMQRRIRLALKFEADANHSGGAGAAVRQLAGTRWPRDRFVRCWWQNLPGSKGAMGAFIGRWNRRLQFSRGTRRAGSRTLIAGARRLQFSRENRRSHDRGHTQQTALQPSHA